MAVYRVAEAFWRYLTLESILHTYGPQFLLSVLDVVAVPPCEGDLLQDRKESPRSLGLGRLVGWISHECCYDCIRLVSWSFLGKPRTTLFCSSSQCFTLPWSFLPSSERLDKGSGTKLRMLGLAKVPSLTSLPLSSSSALIQFNLPKPHSFTTRALWYGLLTMLLQGPPWLSLGLCSLSSRTYHDNSLL